MTPGLQLPYCKSKAERAGRGDSCRVWQCEKRGKDKRGLQGHVRTPRLVVLSFRQPLERGGAAKVVCGSPSRPLSCRSHDLFRPQAMPQGLCASWCLKDVAEDSSWGNSLPFTREMSTNLAKDINKDEIIFSVLTYMMNDSHLTVSMACCSNPGGSVLLLKSTGAADALHLKKTAFLESK